MSETDQDNAGAVIAEPVIVKGGAMPFSYPGYLSNMPLAPRHKYQPVIETETEDDDEFDLVFCHYTYRCDDVESANEGASALVALLDDGWAIEREIVAAPFVTVLFSRVAEDDEE